MKNFIFIGAGILVSGAAHAAVTIDISAQVNNNARTYTSGTDYPSGPTTLTVAGVPFALTTLGTGANTLGVVRIGGNGDETHTFNVSIAVSGPTSLYTLINSGFGSLGSNLGYMKVVGLGGETTQVDLIEGTNVRDHYNGAFVNGLTDHTVVPTYFVGGVSNPAGQVRLDRQEIVLPSTFYGDTIKQVIFFGHDLGGAGQAFLAGATVAPQSAPEPMTLAVLGLGVGALLRRKRK